MQQAIATLRRVRPQIAAADLAAYDAALADVQIAITCCSTAHALADSWADIFGDNDPSVRALRAVLPQVRS